MTRGTVFGYELESELPLTRLGLGPGSRGSVALRRARDRIDLGDARVLHVATAVGFSFTLARRDGLVLARCSAAGGFAVDAHAGAIESDAETLDDLWEHRVLSTVLPLLLAERGDLVVHASAVEIDGAAYLFAGAPGRGKSTLALALAETGAQLIAEDGVAVTFADGALAWPGPTAVRVAPAPGAPKLTRRLEHERHATRPLPVAAVLVLGTRRRGALELASVGPAEAVPLLVPNLIFAGGEALPQAFRHAARLAASVPVGYCTLPDDLTALPRVARELRDMLAGRAWPDDIAAVSPSPPRGATAPRSGARGRGGA